MEQQQRNNIEQQQNNQNNNNQVNANENNNNILNNVDKKMIDIFNSILLYYDDNKFDSQRRIKYQNTTATILLTLSALAAGTQCILSIPKFTSSISTIAKYASPSVYSLVNIITAKFGKYDDTRDSKIKYFLNEALHTLLSPHKVLGKIIGSYCIYDGLVMRKEKEKIINKITNLIIENKDKIDDDVDFKYKIVSMIGYFVLVDFSSKPKCFVSDVFTKYNQMKIKYNTIINLLKNKIEKEDKISNKDTINDFLEKLKEETMALFMNLDPYSDTIKNNIKDQIKNIQQPERNNVQQIQQEVVNNNINKSLASTIIEQEGNQEQQIQQEDNLSNQVQETIIIEPNQNNLNKSMPIKNNKKENSIIDSNQNNLNKSMLIYRTNKNNKKENNIDNKNYEENSLNIGCLESEEDIKENILENLNDNKNINNKNENVDEDKKEITITIKDSSLEDNLEDNVINNINILQEKKDKQKREENVSKFSQISSENYNKENSVINIPIYRTNKNNKKENNIDNKNYEENSLNIGCLESEEEDVKEDNNIGRIEYEEDIDEDNILKLNNSNHSAQKTTKYCQISSNDYYNKENKSVNINKNKKKGGFFNKIKSRFGKFFGRKNKNISKNVKDNLNKNNSINKNI